MLFYHQIEGVGSISYGLPDAGIKHMAPGWGMRFVLLGMLLYGKSVYFPVTLDSNELKRI